MMKTRFFVIILIVAVAASSATTYMIVPVKYTVSVYPEWLRDNMALNRNSPHMFS